MTYTKVDWGAVYAQTYFTSDRCWNTCNGGFCCFHAHYPALNAVRFIHVKGATLLYMEDEFEYILHNTKAPEVQTKSLSLDFGAEKPLRLIYAPCHYAGVCSGIIEKPLICRLYPFIPVFSIEGKVEDWYPATIFDLTLDSIGKDGPCTIKKERHRLFEFFELKPSLLQALSHPYVILYSSAAKVFADIYTAKLICLWA